MKKLGLMMLGLAFAFAGFQSFVEDEVTTSEKTVITAADENWSSDEVEGVDLVQAKSWFVAPCITWQGIPGTTCAYVYPNGNPQCRQPVGQAPCRANS